MLRRLRNDKKAVTPAISTVIITSAIVVMLLVTVVFANNYLNARMAENEFNEMEQFMQTVGLQIDDVAWTVGRTQTMSYASQYGQIAFQSVTLNYALYVNSINIQNFTTGALFFNMPISSYNIANNYTELVSPTSYSSFLQAGPSAPVSHVFVIERVPMNDGNYIRIVVAPSIRMLTSTIATASYYNFYLPLLQPSGNNLHVSQSVTLTAVAFNVQTVQNASNITITVGFPQSALGFDSTFFDFNSSLVNEQVPAGSYVEFYTGNVTVSMGEYA
jgi:hypothetical protein